MKRKVLFSVPTLAVFAGFFLVETSHAHHAEFMSNQPFLQGLSMPVHGVDHVLSAVAVGLVAAQAGGRFLRWLPGLFSLLLLAGGCLNLSGISLPELVVPAAAMLLGAVVWMGSRAIIPLTIIGTAVVALVNGQALLETTFFMSSPLFFCGCLLGALGLCGLGFGAGKLLGLASDKRVSRFAGAAVFIVALLLALLPEWNGSIIRLIE